MPRASAVDEISLQLGRLSIHVRLIEEVQAEPGPVSSGSSRASTSPLIPAARVPEQARQLATPESATPAPLVGDPWAAREAAAWAAGERVGRILRNERWGDPVPSASNLANARWVVLRSADNAVHSPALVFRRWSDAKAIVQDSSRSGSFSKHSVFQAFPSEREARLFVLGSGLQWSPQ
jgi:hypothetical protein